MGSAGTRSSEHCGCIGPGCGFQFRGGGFAAPRLTFRQLRGSAGCLGQVRALEGEFGEGQKVDGWACGSARGVYARRGEPRLGQARVLRPQSGRSGRRASTCGGRPESRGAGVRKKEPASSERIRGLPAESRSRCAGPSPRTASFRTGSRRRAAGPRAGPRGAQAQPVPRATWTHSLFFLILSTHFHRGNPGRLAVLRVVPGDIPPTLGGDPNTQS